MNMFLWALQILLALHTAIGAVWKFSNSEQSAFGLRALPHGVWLGLAILELFCCVGLILPAFKKSAALLIPVAAIIIAVEMLVFCGVQLSSGDQNYSPLIYWLVVAAICAFIAYGRLVLKPI